MPVASSDGTKLGVAALPPHAQRHVFLEQTAYFGASASSVSYDDANRILLVCPLTQPDHGPPADEMVARTQLPLNVPWFSESISFLCAESESIRGATWSQFLRLCLASGGMQTRITCQTHVGGPQVLTGDRLLLQPVDSRLERGSHHQPPRTVLLPTAAPALCCRLSLDGRVLALQRSSTEARAFTHFLPLGLRIPPAPSGLTPGPAAAAATASAHAFARPAAASLRLPPPLHLHPSLPRRPTLLHRSNSSTRPPARDSGRPSARRALRPLARRRRRSPPSPARTPLRQDLISS